jgi:hypothetical protein
MNSSSRREASTHDFLFRTKPIWWGFVNLRLRVQGVRCGDGNIEKCETVERASSRSLRHASRHADTPIGVETIATLAGLGLENGDAALHIRRMQKSDITCPECNAGYRRVEVAVHSGTKGEFRCLVCSHLLEVFDGSAEIAIRLTVQPERTFK